MFMMPYDERAGRAILRNFQGRAFEYLDPEREMTIMGWLLVREGTRCKGSYSR